RGARAVGWGAARGGGGVPPGGRRGGDRGRRGAGSRGGGGPRAAEAGHAARDRDRRDRDRVRARRCRVHVGAVDRRTEELRLVLRDRGSARAARRGPLRAAAGRDRERRDSVLYRPPRNTAPRRGGPRPRDRDGCGGLGVRDRQGCGDVALPHGCRATAPRAGLRDPPEIPVAAAALLPRDARRRAAMKRARWRVARAVMAGAGLLIAVLAVIVA